MQTLWWLPNKVLRHIHKKRFSVFLSRFLRVCNRSVQKVQIRAKRIFYYKIRYGYQNMFFYFLSRFLRIWLQSLPKVLIWSKKKFLWKNCHKTQNFTLISNPLKKVWKNEPKKVISKNVTEICIFSLLLMFVKLVLLVTFFCCIFLQLFQRIRNQREILRFMTSFFYFFTKKNFSIILALLANFEAKCAKNGSKNQKTYFVNVS